MQDEDRERELELRGGVVQRPLWQVAVLLGAVHLVLALGLLLGSLALGGGIDAEEALLPEPLMAVVRGLMTVLVQPGMAAWGVVEAEARGADGLEWTAFVLNSLLWGACAALLLRARLARRGA